MPRVLFPLFLWILAASTAFGARSSPQKLTPVGNGLAFVATTPEDGTELWFTDGTRKEWLFRFRYHPSAACVALDVGASMTLTGSQWAIRYQVYAGGPAFSEVLISSPGRPTIVTSFANLDDLLVLQDVERYATVRVTSGCDERELVSRLDKKKMRSVR